MINVVAAYQSPGLVNILAKSRAWSMRTYPLGDHEGLAEIAEMAVPDWTPEADPDPDVIIVCSPAQFLAATDAWPAAKILWAVHNGYERWLLPEEYETRVAGALCFSEKVRWLQQPGKRVRHFVLSPAYEATPVWSWAPSDLWTLRNRPAGRGDDVDIVIAAITEGMNHTTFGQLQPGGFADAKKKAALRSRSSGYVSAMQRTAGFGLAEHEAFAAGVPVIGGWWGDLGGEMSRDYWGLQHRLYDMREAAVRVCRDEWGARALSWLGLEYIRKYRTLDRMDATVVELLAAIG